jgi:hypothetical protein
MMRKVLIPKELAHLKINEQDYPIPFFVPIIDGEPNFRLLDLQKRDHCVKRKLCPVCGKKLPSDYSYLICGPMGYKNRVSTDSPMHRVCAEFALAVCPHIYFEKAERKAGTAAHVAPKSDTVLLVKISKCKAKFHPETGSELLHFRPASTETYRYQNGVLEKEQP